MLDDYDEQHTSLHEDWMVNSPDPIIFSSDIIDDIRSKYAPEIPLDNNFDKDQNHSLSTEEKFTSEGLIKRENESDDLDFPKARRGGTLMERVKSRNAFPISISLSDISVIKDSLSQYLKTSPVINSPMTFLDSPTFLSNTLVQPSPTTGKLPFLSNKNSTLCAADDSTSFFDDFGSSPFESKPIEDSDSPFPGDTCIVSLDFSAGSSENAILETVNDDTILGGASNSLPLDEHEHQLQQHELQQHEQHEHQQQPEEEDQRNAGNVMLSTSLGDDGYNWRKYGQKQVKCSDYPRSYYKCTHPNCPVKKKVEKSYEGHVTEIIYEKSHNHPEPVSNRRLTNHPSDQLDPNNQNRGGDATNSNLQGQINGVDNGLASNFSNINGEDHNQQGGGGGGLLGYDGEQDEQETKRRKIEASYATDQMSGATRAIRMPRVVVQATSEIDILEDGYRWRKYGQKVVKGNPNPRSYYKCTSANCPVRKHVERASHDLTSVITTYEGKHNHPVPAARNSTNNNNSSSHVTSANQSVGHSAASSVVQSHPHHLLHRVDPYQVQNEMTRFNRPYGMTGRQLIGHPNNGYNNSFGMNQGLGSNLMGMGGMNMGMGMGMGMGGIGMGMDMGIGGMSMNMNMGMGGMNMNMNMGMSPMGGMSTMGGGLGSTNQGNNMSVLPAMAPNYHGGGQQNQMSMVIPKGEPISESSINNNIIMINHNNNNNNINNNMANGSSSSSSTSSPSSVYPQMINRQSTPVGPQI